MATSKAGSSLRLMLTASARHFPRHNSSQTSVVTPMKRLVDALIVVVWLADDRPRHSDTVSKIVGDVEA